MPGNTNIQRPILGNGPTAAHPIAATASGPATMPAPQNFGPPQGYGTYSFNTGGYVPQNIQIRVPVGMNFTPPVSRIVGRISQPTRYLPARIVTPGTHPVSRVLSRPAAPSYRAPTPAYRPPTPATKKGVSVTPSRPPQLQYTPPPSPAPQQAKTPASQKGVVTPTRPQLFPSNPLGFLTPYGPNVLRGSNGQVILPGNPQNSGGTRMAAPAPVKTSTTCKFCSTSWKTLAIGAAAVGGLLLL